MEIEQLQNRFKDDRGRFKPVYLLANPVIKDAFAARPDVAELEGKFYATGVLLYRDTREVAGDSSTSLIVSGSIEDGYVETLNSVYMFVPYPEETE